MVVVLEQPPRLPSVSRPRPIAAAVATDANALFITDSSQMTGKTWRAATSCVGWSVARRVPSTADAGRVPGVGDSRASGALARQRLAANRTGDRTACRDNQPINASASQQLQSRLPRRQRLRRINRAALIAQFKVQHDTVGIGVAHLGDLFAARDRLAFLH